jgi:ApaG protein
MVTQITSGIKISVETSFEGTFFKNYKVHFAFGYEVTIENLSQLAVQLDSRFWEIHDALNHLEVVEGEGVIGQQPIIYPGSHHTYSSGCLLVSPFGAMQGHYNMIGLDAGNQFKVQIPKFDLAAPFATN